MKTSTPPNHDALIDKIFSILKNSRQLQICKNVFIEATGHHLMISPATKDNISLAKSTSSDSWQKAGRKSNAPIKYGVWVVGLLEIDDGDANTEFLLKIFANSLSSYLNNIDDRK